jgi:putative flippase GtrA
MVGIWNTIFGYLLFVGIDTLFSYIFAKRYVAYMSAAIIANVIAIINAYISHKYVTFKSRVRGSGIIKEFARFFSSYLFSFILGLILLPLIVEMFHIDPKIAAALILIVTVIISYLSHSRFSFRQS